MALCMYVGEGSVHVAGSASHIAVTPDTFRAGTRFDFTVTVSPGPSGGGLDLEIGDDDGGRGIRFHGPAIQTDDTGWYFGAEHEPTD